MNSNYNSKNNNDKSINNNDNDTDNNIITFLIFVNNVFFTLCLNIFKGYLCYKTIFWYKVAFDL